MTSDPETESILLKRQEEAPGLPGKTHRLDALPSVSCPRLPPDTCPQVPPLEAVPAPG